jgi:hypothetical protein
MNFRSDAAARGPAGQHILAALGIVGVLALLSACAEGNSSTNLASPAPAPAATAVPAAPPAATPKPPPQRLTATEINEQCWMSSEVNKVKDLDAKARLVDKCVAEKSRAQQGM